MPVKKKSIRKKEVKTKPIRKKSSGGATRNNIHKRSWLSILVIVSLIGGFVTFLMYINKLQIKSDDTVQEDKTTETINNSPKANNKPKQQFDFYTVLPDRKVDVIKIKEVPKPVSKPLPVIKQEKVDSKPVQKKVQNTNKTVLHTIEKKDTNKPSNHYSKALYQLQVGAFNDLPKAEARKANLGLMGVISNIQRVHLNGKSIYRVRVGPSSDRTKMDSIKAQLKRQNIDTFIQKL
jgi:cell division protein FtsN